MRILTVGTPIDSLKKVPEGWVRVNCQKCNSDMICREKNVKSEINDEVVLLCINCVHSLVRARLENSILPK